MDRKRTEFQVRTHEYLRYDRKAFSERISKFQLKKLVWQKPLIKIAKDFDVAIKTITYWCKKWDINTPPRGYWNRKTYISKNKKPQ